MSRSKKKLDEGFWITDGSTEGENQLARLIELSGEGFNKIHSTVILNGLDVDITDSQIGPRTTIGKRVGIHNITIGADCVICDDVYLEEVDIPDGSWVEATNSYGRRNTIVLIWTPKDGLLIKPGCYPVEPVEETLQRLQKPELIPEWEVFFGGRCNCITCRRDRNPDAGQKHAAELIYFLKEMKGYKVV